MTGPERGKAVELVAAARALWHAMADVDLSDPTKIHLSEALVRLLTATRELDEALNP